MRGVTAICVEDGGNNIFSQKMRRVKGRSPAGEVECHGPAAFERHPPVKVNKYINNQSSSMLQTSI